MNKNRKYMRLLSLGIFLLSACIVGTCIASTSIYYDSTILERHVLVIPYLLSYTFILIGLVGSFDIVSIMKKAFEPQPKSNSN